MGQVEGLSSIDRVVQKLNDDYKTGNIKVIVMAYELNNEPAFITATAGADDSYLSKLGLAGAIQQDLFFQSLP